MFIRNIIWGVLMFFLAACLAAPEVADVPIADVRSLTTFEVEETRPIIAVKEPSNSLLDTVKSRGKLICGGNASLPGFGFLEQDGTFTGFDSDFCRVLAVAIFGTADDSTLEIRPTTALERFILLQTGEIDVLIRNTAWTTSRDTDLLMEFGPIIFYDGQGFMVRVDSGIKKIEDLNGSSICVQAGTTTEFNLANEMSKRGLNYEPKVYADFPSTQNAYDAGSCDAITTDKSGLNVMRLNLSNPENHTILAVTISKEPLSPVVRQGDDQWHDIVKWAVLCTVAAEEEGITSTNIEQVILTTDKFTIRQMLGIEGNLGEALGLGNDFCANITRQMGNYGEIYDRNFGAYMPRGINNIWTQGGLLYSPPFIHQSTDLNFFLYDILLPVVLK